MFFRKAVCLHVALDRGHCPMQFYSVLTIPGVTKTGEPLMRMGLQDGRAGTYDFPTLAPPCSQAHTGGASAAMGQADPQSSAKHVGELPRACHPRRRQGSGSRAGPIVHLDAPLAPEDGPADLAEKESAGPRPQ